MNTEEKNNYVQYVNRHGIVKAKNVVFEDDGTTTRFTVDGIDEEFFIFAIYQNNIQRFCVGIDNLENTDMLGFINANMVDLSSIPPYAFLQSQTVVQFSYNNEYVQNYKFGSGASVGSVVQDEPDLKYLKDFLINWFGSLDGFFIEPYFDASMSAVTAKYIGSGSAFFGRFFAVNGYFNDNHISGVTSIKGCSNGQFNVFGDGFFNGALEGDDSRIILKGYKISHPTYFS